MTILHRVGLGRNLTAAEVDGNFDTHTSDIAAVAATAASLLTLIAAGGVPVGGTAGQVLAKNSSTNGDTHWVNQSGGGGGGASNYTDLIDASTVDLPNINTPLQTALALLAPKASPVFTGVPTAPTASVGTSTVQIATTAYVIGERTATATLTGKTISGISNTLQNLPANAINGVIPIANLATGTPTGSKFVRDDNTLQTIAGGGDALTASSLAQFAATTSAQLAGVISDETGTGVLVFNNAPALTSPVLTTPTLGVATATSINKVALTAPATAATLTIANNKTLTANNTLTFTGTDGSSVAFGAGGTAAYTAGTLAQFAATTSAQLAGVLSDEVGTGRFVLDTSPTISGLTITGVSTVAGAQIITPAAMGANVIDITAGVNTKTVTGPVTYTFSTAPTVNGTTFSLELNVTTASTVTLPSFISGLTQGSARTTVYFPLGKWLLFFKYDGTSVYLYGEPGSVNNDSATVAPTVTDDSTKGYLSGSRWVNTSVGAVYICYDSTATNAQWARLDLGGTSGDLSSNTATSVDSEVMLFSSTTGKLAKRATTTGIAKLTSGVLSAATAGTDYYNPGGTDVAVADGGTGLSAGTSGGFLAFTGTTTLASTGALTANSPVLGGGAGVVPKVVAGITSDGTSRLQLGVAGGAVGGLELRNATSGTLSIVPATGALGTTVLTAPATTGTLATALQTFAMGFAIDTVANQDYTICLRMPFAGTITETSSKCTSGTATATFKIGSTALGGTANAVSSSQVNTAQASLNTFTANDLVLVTMSANSSCLGANFVVKYTRTLA